MEVAVKIDSTTIESMFNEYFEKLCRYAFTILRNQEEAEEIVQRLFIKIWEKRKTIEMQEVQAYLYQSTKNFCLNEIKRVKIKTADYLEINEQSHNSVEPDESIISSELKEKIEESMRTLPEKCQAVFRLSRMKNLSYKEIADELNISVKTVENHMGKALKLMRVELSEYLPQIIATILILKGW